MNVIYILGTEKGACIDPPDHDGGKRIRQRAPLTRWIGPAADAIIHPAEDHRGDLPRLAILFGKDEDGAGARVLLNGTANRPLAELSLRHPVRERQFVNAGVARLTLPGRVIPPILPMQLAVDRREGPAQGRRPRAAASPPGWVQATASLSVLAARAREHLCFALAVLGSLIGTAQGDCTAPRQVSANCRVCNIKAGVRLLRRSEHRDAQDSNRSGRRGDCHGSLDDYQRLHQSSERSFESTPPPALRDLAGDCPSWRRRCDVRNCGPVTSFVERRRRVRHRPQIQCQAQHLR
jgi:hypothetical protein